MGGLITLNGFYTVKQNVDVSNRLMYQSVSFILRLMFLSNKNISYSVEPTRKTLAKRQDRYTVRDPGMGIIIKLITAAFI